MSLSVTPKGKVVYSTLTTPQGFKGSDKNKKYSIGVKFSGDAATAMKEIFKRAKGEGDSVVVYFNRKEDMGAPEVKTDGGLILDKNILDKETDVQVAYSIKPFEFSGMTGESYIMEKVKVYAPEKATIEVSENDAPF